MFSISSIFHVFIISKLSAFLFPPGVLYIMHAYFFQTAVLWDTFELICVVKFCTSTAECKCHCGKGIVQVNTFLHVE